jgi:4-amino-4-deoxy-L-arabinose transferase-like glycosyltransferase
MMLGVQAFSTLTTPPDLFGPAGHLVSLAGLFGLYPALADRMLTVARIAVSVAIVGAGSWALLTLTRFLAVAGFVTSVSNVLPAVFFVLVFASTILTYVLFGVAALHIDSESRLVGSLLLVPAALLVVALVGSATRGVTVADGMVIGSGLAVSMVALGHTLRTWDRPTNPAAPTGDVSVR